MTMPKPKNFLEACNELATETYDNHDSVVRRRPALSELLAISKFYNESEKKIQNLEHEEFDYFSKRSHLTLSHLSHTIGYEQLVSFCTKLWDIQFFNFILNDIKDRYLFKTVDVVTYRDFEQVCDLEISEDDYFIKIENITEVKSGDYYFIFEIEDIWTGKCHKFAYFMDFR